MKSYSNPAWLNEMHPNYSRWKKGRELSTARGELVLKFISEEIDLTGLKILDLGSGEGGTTNILSKNNFVVSADISKTRLLRQLENFQITSIVNASASKLPFKDDSFNLITLQDVIEHFSDLNIALSEIHRVISKNGILYLSTPNRFSLINIIADPHWGLPVVSVLPRESVRKYFLKFFRKDEIKRTDIAELFSLNEIYKMFSARFEIKILTKSAVNMLLGGHEGIIWSEFHLKSLRLIKKMKLDGLLRKIANNRKGVVNYFLTPTFYLIMIKKSV